ncbi:maturase K [Capsicum annuum]|nr:maturase K [Capsicum annuum]
MPLLYIYYNSISVNHSMIYSKMLENLFLINNAIKKFDTLVQVIPFIGSLAKARFCTVLGHPISKMVWSILSDFDITNRFKHMCRNLFHHFSESFKKITLYQIKYILWLSCPRNLARKYKSVVHTFEKIGLKIIGRILNVGRISYFFDLPMSFI